ncbi:class I SAM-dependent methyltransferase [Micromonospora sp. NPDC048842]|uniref:class I SAM-dependent methyltransferase n=1 Tax=Micromonospora sp. NPDC048842 TaxID=3154346 RepID=UPI0033CBFD0A
MVRRGYDALSYHYRSDDADDGQYAPWLAGLHQRLPASAAILDLGCGCGVPVARSLANAGHRVTGVDISEVQIERARPLLGTAPTGLTWSEPEVKCRDASTSSGSARRGGRSSSSPSRPGGRAA